MATTSIMPLHTGKGRSVRRAIQDSINYVKNPAKTDEGRLVTSYQCNGEIADAEFLLAKRQYIAATGRVRGKDDIIAYHLRQSFVPGEITPEEANRLGQELARRFTKGNHAFIVCTHIDKAHVHNHIIWNAVNLDCDRKFRNFLGSTRAVRRLSDTICIENGYSIVLHRKRLLHCGKSKTSQQELQQVAGRCRQALPPGDAAPCHRSGAGAKAHRPGHSAGGTEKVRLHRGTPGQAHHALRARLEKAGPAVQPG